jgi:hypothetical protein
MPNEVNRFAEHGRKVVEILARGGTVADARNYAERIGDAEYRDQTLAKLAAFLAEHSSSDAFEVAESVREPLGRADAFLEVGRTLARRNAQLDARRALMEAVAATNAIARSTWEVPSVLLEAGTALHALAMPGEAVELIRRAVGLAQAGGDTDSTKVLGGCAVVLAKWGHRDEAASTASLIQDAVWRELTIRRIQAHE